MAMANFTDTSTECAICLSPLDDGGGDDKTITLSCGHRWHLTCLKEQLENARPSRSKRLVFSGCRCAKCNTFCDHPELENLTRRTDALREKVDVLVAEQLKADAAEAWRDARKDALAKARLVEEGRRSYAFYLCGGCDEPYFGGTIECADEEEGERITSEDRLCQSCSPKSQVVCQHTFEHRPYHVWKCRYCCNPSSFVCYGNVHFCNSCHNRNSKRARQRGQGAKPPALQGIQCRGGSCPFPKPEGTDQHSNGPGIGCEQVYYCAACESSPTLLQEIPGSRNFIINPSGEEGMRGWRHHSRHARWTVENMSISVDNSTRTNFVSTFQWCSMSQTVPLYQYVQNPFTVQLEISAKFMGRTDCPSVFKMEAAVLNSQGRILHRTSTSQQTSPADFWEKASLIIDPIDGAHEVIMIVHGKDSRFWQGNYGSKVCHCSVRVLGLEEELQSILLPEQNQVQAQHRHQPDYAYIRERARDIFLPILLIIFFWLISE